MIITPTNFVIGEHVIKQMGEIHATYTKVNFMMPQDVSPSLTSISDNLYSLLLDHVNSKLKNFATPHNADAVIDVQYSIVPFYSKGQKANSSDVYSRGCSNVSICAVGEMVKLGSAKDLKHAIHNAKLNQILK